MFTVCKFKGAEAILKDNGLDEGGRVQKFFTSEIMRVSSPYLPFREGVLEASCRIVDTNDALIYDTPYARYLWFGKLMVDPITGKGAFFDPRTGRFWSRPNTPKRLTDRDLVFRGAPMRGPQWVIRAWIDHKDEVIRATQAEIGGNNR